MTTNDVERALRLCEEFHKGQKDRNGLPYHLHCIRVMEKQETDERRVIALLHDSIEDGESNVSDLIRQEFGDTVWWSVISLTHLEKNTYEQYIDMLIKSENTDAWHVKMADIEDNTSIGRLDEKAALKMPTYRAAYKRLQEALLMSGRG